MSQADHSFICLSLSMRCLTNLDFITHRTILREAKDENGIHNPKAVLVAMRKDQNYRETKLRLLHKLFGIKVLCANYDNTPDGERDWYIGYHVYESKLEVISRVRDRKSISCFCTNNEKGEVHVAFYDGEERNVTISYLTFAYNTTRCVVQDTGVHFCSFVFKKQDNSDNAKVTRVSKKDLRSSIVSYALMLPFIKKNEMTLQQYTLVYWDWEVLRCEDAEHKKGHPGAEKSVFEHILALY